jgi:hypothetical protein
MGLFKPDGTPATGTIPGGSIVVSQLADCPRIIASDQKVFSGGICPITSNAPGILLTESLDQPLYDSVVALKPLINAFAEGEDDTSLNVFGEMVLRKDWSENLSTALRYTRTQGGASGLGGAVIRDTVNLSNTWAIAEKWQLAVRGDWSLRKSVVDDQVSQFVTAGPPLVVPPPQGVPLVGFHGSLDPAGANNLISVTGGGAGEIDTMRWGVAGRLTHRFTRNTSSWLQVTYNEQTSQSDTLGDPSDFENFLVVLGVRHVFDPIKLW